MSENFEIPPIKEVLPHRYPFLLVDKVLECNDHYVKAVKNVSFNEHFFNGHFPENPVMPGVLLIEAIAQASCFISYAYLKNIPVAEENKNNTKLDVLFMGIDSAKFRRVVVPGDQLILEAWLIKKKKTFWWIDGKATVNGELACEARMSALVKNGE
ncbi:MAG: 3-hydroxyacyl-ACP dehydratase FabZ [Deferribacteraceae bacterium]|jgi:beta-hydroxyacyl-ACP dehydratase FabZ|nr:3-hydroxyacyl-ACP dehydratase FabZ [Deferribacteraceae bacterium]